MYTEKSKTGTVPVSVPHSRNPYMIRYVVFDVGTHTMSLGLRSYPRHLAMGFSACHPSPAIAKCRPPWSLPYLIGDAWALGKPLGSLGPYLSLLLLLSLLLFALLLAVGFTVNEYDTTRMSLLQPQQMSAVSLHFGSPASEPFPHSGALHMPHCTSRLGLPRIASAACFGGGLSTCPASA